jgi:lysozyme
VKRLNKKVLIGMIIVLFCLMLLFAILVYKKIIIINHPSNERYPIAGVDISHYQGNINWNDLARQNIDFAFIKATEGSGTVDEYFKQNWSNAQETTIIIGAYHFFSFDSSVETQAENYISSVGSLNGKLPPVIDFEFYSNYEDNPPDVNITRAALQNLLDKLENYYGAKPMIYATAKSYNLYIKDEFNDYSLWIRNVYYSPNIGMKNKWKFWQYTDRAVLEGYHSDEEYIDMNVFNGTEEDFRDMILK